MVMLKFLLSFGVILAYLYVRYKKQLSLRACAVVGTIALTYLAFILIKTALR
jgi:hypothetical protein